jgi:RNA polymerase sigma-70 factor, ECF subfamily
MASNEDLVRWLSQAANGDQEAFKNLYEATSPKLFGLAVKMLKNRGFAEDVCQETYIKIWHHAAEYHGERGSVMTWITAILRYRALDKLRSIKPEEPLDNEQHEQANHEPGPFYLALQGQQAAALQGCMEEISTEQQMSIALAFFEGLTHQELTVRLQAPLGTVKSWIRRGMESLRRCLER